MPFAFIFTMFMPVLMVPINIYLCVKSEKYRGWYCFLIAFGFAALAFHFRPLITQNTDILRHWTHMESTKSMTLADVSGHRVFSGLVGYYLLLKLFSYANHMCLMQATVTFVGYFLCLYVIRKTDDCSDSKISFLAVFMFLSCTSFLGFCSGIRQYLVFSVFFFTFYWEAVRGKGKRICWVIYGLLVTMHTSATIIIALRLIAMFFTSKRRIKIASAILLLWSATQKTVVTFLAENYYGNDIVRKFVELSGFYEENPSDIVPLVFIWKLAMLVFCTVMAYSVSKHHNEENILPQKYVSFAFFTCIFALGGIASYDIFARFSVFAILLSTPLLPDYFKKMQAGYKELCRWGLTAVLAFILVFSVDQYLTFHFSPLPDILVTNFFTLLGAI